MAKTLANYDPLVQIPSGMTPAGADFPIVESHDILVGENDKRLDAKLDDIDSAIGNVGQTPIATQLSSKVNTGDIVTSVAATGSTSNNKIPSETAVRAAIEAKTINVDSTVTEGSTNAVSGGAVHTQLATKQDTLTFDTTPTASSSNPVTSGGVKTALDAKQDTLTFDTAPTASSSNPVTSGGVKAALDNKQNTLTYETTPIVGSVNPVTSTGIRNAIDTAAAANLGTMQAQYDEFVADAEDVLDRAASLSNGMVACSNIAAETTVGDTRILLYTGTTNANYTNGHWYYNSAASNATPVWTDGGAVGSAPTIDNTLTTAGAAADSKSVGDAIENIVTISDTQPGSNSGNKVWIKETTDEEVQIPTYEEHISKANKADITTNNESDNGSGTITASKAYAIGDHFYINNTNTSSENYGVSTLYKATAAIASGDAIVVGTNCEASKVADEITSLSNDIDTIKADLNAVALYNGTYPLELENGAINFAVAPWGYIAQDNRLRTKQGTKIHLEQGDTITFKYNRLFTLYVGWIDMSGVSHNSNNWEGFSFVAPEEGDYAFIIRPTTGTISLAEAQDSIYIKSASNSQNNKLNDFVLLKPIPYSVHSGYISSTGEITLPTSPKNEKYTDLIPVKNGYTIYTHLVYTDASISPSMWLVYCLYDKYKQFISRINIRPNNNSVIDDISKVTVNNADAAYIQFSFGTWGDTNYTFDIRSPYAIDIDFLQKENKIDLYSAKTTYNVRSILHRGYYGYPENTLNGYKEGKRQGFDTVECDVRFTSDHVAVLLHDTSINRTARNVDGTELSSTVNIANITYDVAKTYDYGLYQGFPAGVTIPTFEEFLLLCKRLSLRPYVEVKAGTDAEITSLAVSSFEYGMLDKITWIADNYERLLPILAYDDTARVGYVTGKIEDWLVTAIQTYLQTGKNEAFAFTSDYGGAFDYHLSKCITAKIPVEIWIADDASTIVGLDPYITGIESNKLIAQEVLYKYALT